MSGLKKEGGGRLLAVSDSVCGTGGRKRSLDPIYLCVYTNACVPGLLFHMLQSSPFDAHYLNKKISQHGIILYADFLLRYFHFLFVVLLILTKDRYALFFLLKFQIQK